MLLLHQLHLLRRRAERGARERRDRERQRDEDDDEYYEDDYWDDEDEFDEDRRSRGGRRSNNKQSTSTSGGRRRAPAAPEALLRLLEAITPARALEMGLGFGVRAAGSEEGVQEQGAEAGTASLNEEVVDGKGYRVQVAGHALADAVTGAAGGSGGAMLLDGLTGAGLGSPLGAGESVPLPGAATNAAEWASRAATDADHDPFFDVPAQSESAQAQLLRVQMAALARDEAAAQADLHAVGHANYFVNETAFVGLRLRYDTNIDLTAINQTLSHLSPTDPSPPAPSR
jgi:hypothetical protein